MYVFQNTETEMQSHWTRTKDMMAAGERLIENGQSREDIQVIFSWEFILSRSKVAFP